MITIKGSEFMELLNCDCENIMIENLTLNTEKIKIRPRTLEEIIYDYNCHNVHYNPIGEIEGFNYQMSAIKQVGRYFDVWIRCEAKDSEIDPHAVISVFNSKTGKSKEVLMSDVKIVKAFTIEKVRVDCAAKRTGTIVVFTYVKESGQLSTNFLPVYYDEHALRPLEFERQKLIYNNVCIR
ncbi:hypothetical protein Q73A0000_10650 [Kaistella flava (ex Peng et al. 2021)]|uniref:Uncharacterized protein n=1 Tax=Kaistella flava (ex Peng et al. 2021) TaxID=2038776 RepID=A0A7M2Y9I0_9FLAO|nr:hypothetical protein [Kaistella flava (ex Peng et al. 2021)]QOW10801.1 hypothetical protein Q73A0000_10650 [Kaistella flava (ex Peng et al. 2021)]